MASLREKLMRKLTICLIVMICLIHPAATAVAQATRAQKGQPSPIPRTRVLNPREITSIIRAVEDEIYDYSQERDFDDIGIATDGPTGRTIQVSIYIDPKVTGNGEGEVIYKDMPYGEIVRIFHVSADGMVYLFGKPSLGFPVTQISHYTVFMDDDELCRDKAHWLRRVFIVQENPSKELINEAAKRQLLRVGYSDYLDKLDSPSAPQ